MTAEGTPSVNRPALGNQQMRLAVLVVLAVAVGLVLWLVVFHTSAKRHPGSNALGIPPIGFSAKNLAAESRYINTKFYWAGKQQGYLYEFTRNKKGWLYVRYLPPGVRVGVTGGNFLIVVTYPFPGGFHALKKAAHGKAVAGPGGSIVFQRPKFHKSVLMAFPGVNDQIEIYAPSGAIALATAESGKIKPVTKG